MAYSYDEMLGSESDPSDHDSHNMPQASQHYAGDVLPIGTDPYSRVSPSDLGRSDASSVPYALGNKGDPKILSIGKPTLKSWADRKSR